jgi:hypothetical protein
MVSCVSSCRLRGPICSYVPVFTMRHTCATIGTRMWFERARADVIRDHGGHSLPLPRRLGNGGSWAGTT